MTERKWAFALAGEGTDALDIDVFDIVGERWAEMPATCKEVAKKLKLNDSAKTIRMRINSQGGDVAEGVAIYNILREHSARKEVTIVGVAASIASVIAMAGDEIVMPAGTLMMIHNAWAIAIGDGRKMRQVSEYLETNNQAIADIYAQRTGQSVEDIRKMMDETTWLKPERAKELGFADKVIKAKKGQEKAGARALAQAKAEDLQNLPEELRAELETAAAELAQASSKESNPEPPAPAPEPNEGAQSSQQPAPPEKNVMNIKNILKALNLTEETTDEAGVLSAINRLKSSAHVGSEIEKLLGSVGAEAIGAVKALKEAQAQGDQLAVDLEKVKVSMARRDFETLRDQGLKDRKLTVAEAKHYTDRFEAAVKVEAETGKARSDGSDVANELRGWLKVAARRPVAAVNSPRIDENDGGGAAVQHNGKTYEQLKPAERASLKKSNPELFETMREDAVARGAI